MIRVLPSVRRRDQLLLTRTTDPAAQQPEVNIIRVALQGFAAVSGGTQSLHTNGFDEALALPTERSARIALRTQQVLAHESGVADTVDPFAGSYFVESLTDEIEARSKELDTIDDVDILRVDPASEEHQLRRLAAFKEARDTAAVEEELEQLRDAARGEVNLLDPIREALRAGASIGETCGAMRDVFGEYRGGAFF